MPVLSAPGKEREQDEDELLSVNEGDDYDDEQADRRIDDEYDDEACS